MKRISVALVALLLVQEEKKWCDVSKTQARDYCSACAYWPAADQIEKGQCKRCKGKIEKAGTCIKVYWECPKAHGRPMRHSKNCGASPGCCREMPSLSLVTYACDRCHREQRKEADVKHGYAACEGRIRRKCALSGKFPHGGDEPK